MEWAYLTPQPDALFLPKCTGRTGRYKTGFRRGRSFFERATFFNSVATTVPIAPRQTETKLAIMQPRKQNVSVSVPLASEDKFLGTWKNALARKRILNEKTFLLDSCSHFGLAFRVHTFRGTGKIHGPRASQYRDRGLRWNACGLGKCG